MPSFNKGSYTEYSNKIGLYSNSQGSFISQSPDVVLNFPYKDCVLEGGMTKEDAKRDERFLNVKLDKRDIDTLFDPKVLTNFKYIDSNGERELSANDNIGFFDGDGELKQNLLIKGNNLVALHTLKEKLAGKVKLIYIDPPYNTGNDEFRYNDRFNHSAWLAFMENRLKVARHLLSDGGLIFISIDDHEQAYLEVLADEIFGIDNREAVISWRRRHNQPNDKSKIIATVSEYILVYAKNSSYLKSEGSFYTLPLSEDRLKAYKNRDDDPRGPWDTTPWKAAANQGGSVYTITTPTGRQYTETWLGNEDTFRKAVQNNLIVFTNNGDGLPRKKIFASERMRDGQPAINFWSHEQFGSNQDGSSEVGALFGGKDHDGPDNPKPEKLLFSIIHIATKPGDIVLDFCLGSGTTAAVAHKMGRRWIGIEQMDYIETIAKERLKKVIAGEQGGISKSVNWQGGGSFIYMELKKYNQEYVDQINAATNMTELEEVYKKMYQNAFLKFWFDKKTFERDERFRSMDLNTRKQALISILDENQLYLNYADMDDVKYHVSDDERALTKCFYGDRLDNDDDTEAEE